jgi:adenylate kinase family enzyme
MSKLSIVMGPPLSGKTTFISSKLISEPNIKHISVGKICREESEKDTELGRLLQESIKNNTFLDSDILLSLILGNQDHSASVEYILDGFPKYHHEIEPLLSYCQNHKIELYRLYRIDTNIIELLRRLRLRYTCKACYKPIQGRGRCSCGGQSFKREEDGYLYFFERYWRHRKHSRMIFNLLQDKLEVVHA